MDDLYGMAERSVTTPAAVLRRIERIRRELDELEQTVSGLVVTDLGQADLMGVSEVAEALGVSTGLISTWVSRGKLPPPIARLAATPVWTTRQLDVIRRLVARETQQRRASNEE